MMRQKAGVKQIRQRYSDEFKEQALRRAEQEKGATVAKDLKLPASQLYAWRIKAQQRGQTSEEQRLQQAENAKLKGEVARLEEEVAFLKNQLSSRRRREVEKMNAQLAIAPITEAWDEFKERSHIGSIVNEEHYDLMVGIANGLADEGATDEKHPSHDLFMMVSDLIYVYDQGHYPLPPVSGIDVLRFLMEQHGLTRSELPEIGKQSVVSEILAGKRSLTVDHIRNISKRFGVSPNSFF